MKKHIDLTQGSIPRHLSRMTIPMIGGIFAIMAFNLADTYFIAQLGKEPLAAIGFTLPVVMIIGSLAMGVGMGASSCISRALGEENHGHVRRLATDGLLLAVVLVFTFGLVGLETIDPLFTLLGAKPELLPLIHSYMQIWYSCLAFLFIPMVGNNMIRSTGDTLFPSLIMIAGAGINVILDPILIFGKFGAPEMGISGAAVATVASRFCTTIASLFLLVGRYKLLSFSRPKLHELLNSWKQMLHVAIPSAGTQMLMPVSRALVIKLAARFGTEAVAALGTGIRIEGFVYIVCIAMGSCLIPLCGQNWGARRMDRVRLIQRCSMAFDITYGLGGFFLALFFARPIASCFSEDPEIISTIVLYLRMILLGSAMHHVGVHAGFIFNAIGKPLHAAIFNTIRMPFAQIGMALIGIQIGGLRGMLVGIGIAPILTGTLALGWLNHTFSKREHELLEENENKEKTP